MTIFLPNKISQNVINILHENNIPFDIKHFYHYGEHYHKYIFLELVIERFSTYPEIEGKLEMELSANHNEYAQKFHGGGGANIYDNTHKDVSYIDLGLDDIERIKNMIEAFGKIVDMINDNLENQYFEIYKQYCKKKGRKGCIFC